MTAERSLPTGNTVRELLVGMAAATVLIAIAVVGIELQGASTGDPVDAGWIAIAALTAVVTIGGARVAGDRT